MVKNLGDCWQWEANGQCVKETIAVSTTISINVEKVHHQIRLRILSCGRMSENHRGPEVPEVETNLKRQVLGLSCANHGVPVWWGRRGFTRQPESPNVHILGFRPAETPPKFNEKDQQESEKRIKTVAGEGKKERNFGRSGGGGSSGKVNRQWCAGFGVSGSVQVFLDENRNRKKQNEEIVFCECEQVAN